MAGGTILNVQKIKVNNNATLPNILRTARAGSPARAWGLFVEGGWLEAVGDAKALTLKGRLLKDQAKSVSGAAAGKDRLRLYGEAGEAYAASAKIEAGSYPLINAATLALLGGKEERAKALARDVLNMLDENPLEAETPYWLAATRSEALLLLGQEAEARAALSDAIRKAPQAWEDHAATIGQFRLILSELGADAGWLERHLPPASLHFQGVMSLAPDEAALRSQIDAWLETENIGFGYGALAAGADIVVAEALLARGAELHILLPCDQVNFRAQSVEASAGDWGARFDALMAAADSADHLAAAEAPCPDAVDICEAAAMGLARQNAKLLQSRAIALRIDRDRERAETRLSRWTESGGQSHIMLAENSKPRGAREFASCGSVAALLAFRGPELKFDKPPTGLIAQHNLSAVTILQFSGAAEAWQAARALRASGDDGHIPVAIDQGMVKAPIEQSALFLRACALCEIAAEGQLLASKAAAFPLLAKYADIRVEEAGEVRAVIGAFPAYAIISSS
ncbi:MAG: hypothetical protein V3V15_09715 [Sphingorhabdus sp.]